MRHPRRAIQAQPGLRPAHDRVVELKLGRFRAADKGQVELYLRWLDKHERRLGEDAPLGIISCAEKGEQTVELLELEASDIHVAQYLTALPPREVLEAKLAAGIQRARARQIPQAPA